MTAPARFGSTASDTCRPPEARPTITTSEALSAAIRRATGDAGADVTSLEHDSPAMCHNCQPPEYAEPSDDWSGIPEYCAHGVRFERRCFECDATSQAMLDQQAAEAAHFERLRQRACGFVYIAGGALLLWVMVAIVTGR